MKRVLSATKIVCTLGPASSNPEMIEALINAGMNVARLNFSHGEHSVHAQNVAWIREISSRMGKEVAILQDLQGPKIRVGKLKEGKLTITAGENYTLRYAVHEDTPGVIPIDYENLASDTTPGARILLDDGLLAMRVLEIKGNDVHAEVIVGGLLKSRKGVNFPDNTLSIPSVTEKDMHDLLFGVSQQVDYVALSFVRDAKDVVRLKNTLTALGADTPVVSKIEMLSAVQNIDAICAESDAIMVARGDLGVECGFPLVSAFQKKIVSAARKQGKPVIVATQMLDSMIENMRPTKSEICDVANAVFDLADATMLSGETASGKYPLQTVKTMRSILDEVEQSGKLVQREMSAEGLSSIPELIGLSAAELACEVPAKAIVCMTLTGKISMSIARHRPTVPVIAISPRPDVCRRLALVRGVHPLQNKEFISTDVALAEIGNMLIEKGFASKGDLVILTGGIPVSEMRPTNLVKLHRI